MSTSSNSTNTNSANKPETVTTTTPHSKTTTTTEKGTIPNGQFQDKSSQTFSNPQSNVQEEVFTSDDNVEQSETFPASK